MGESGSGKTTMGSSIIKLHNITEGEIFFNGYRIATGITNFLEAIEREKKKYKEKFC